MNKQFDWKNIKKTDWIVLALIGAILLVIVLPDENNRTWQTENKQSDTVALDTGTIGETGKSDVEKYTTYLEERLEDVLEEMDGVGKVEVMITLSDSGESVVEKDTKDIGTSVTETDAEGNRSTYEWESQSETVRIENENGNYPYVGKELLPTIEGIVVVAEGGGNATVVSQISKAVMALFPVEAHKIIVVKMSQGG